MDEYTATIRHKINALQTEAMKIPISNDPATTCRREVIVAEIVAYQNALSWYRQMKRRRSELHALKVTI